MKTFELCRLRRLSFVLFGFFAAACLGQEKQTPLTLDEIENWLRLPEAERPTEEIVEAIKRRAVDFRLGEEQRPRLRAVAVAAQRPEDFGRQILQAIEENWILDRIRLLVKTDKGLDRLAAMVSEEGVQVVYASGYEDILRKSGNPRQPQLVEAALALLWPPLEPKAPDFKMQHWRVPGNMPLPPLHFDSDEISGQVDLDLVVDGKVLVVVKHAHLFYNIACGADLKVNSVKFSSPLPRLPFEQWDYWLKLNTKPAGNAYACPEDRRCQGGMQEPRNKEERECRWRDVESGPDQHGFANARFLIDDHPSGAHPYQVEFHWAVKPYQPAWLLADLRRYGVEHTVEKIYRRGAGFQLDVQWAARFREAGATNRMLDEIGRNVRATNRPVSRK